MSKPARRHAAKQTTLRHVWLASMGAASLGRARVADVADRYAETAGNVAVDATTLMRDAGLVLRGAALTVQEHASPVWSGIQARVASGVFGLLSAFEVADPPPSPSSSPSSRRARATRHRAGVQKSD